MHPIKRRNAGLRAENKMNPHITNISWHYGVNCLSHAVHHFASVEIHIFIEKKPRYVSLQCSFSVCLKTRDDNQRAVEQFAEQWRPKVHTASNTGGQAAASLESPLSTSSAYGSSTSSPSAEAERFLCYYDTSDAGRVIMRKTYSRSDVVHCMLWPSLAVVISGAVFLYLEARRTHLTCCGRGENDDGDAAADGSCGSSSTRDEEKAAFKVTMARPPRATSPRPPPMTTTPHDGKATNNNGTTIATSAATATNYQRQDNGRSPRQGTCQLLAADGDRLEKRPLTRLDNNTDRCSPYGSRSPAMRADDGGYATSKKYPLLVSTDGRTATVTVNGGVERSYPDGRRIRSSKQPQQHLLRPDDSGDDVGRRRKLSQSASSLIGLQVGDELTSRGFRPDLAPEAPADGPGSRAGVGGERPAQSRNGACRVQLVALPSPTTGLTTSSFGLHGRSSSEYRLANV
jgi:hypothetical protein